MVNIYVYAKIYNKLVLFPLFSDIGVQKFFRKPPILSFNLTIDYEKILIEKNEISKHSR